MLEKKVQIHGFFGAPEEIFVGLSLRKKNFRCGETIDAEIFVENRTAKKIREIGVAFLQEIQATIGSSKNQRKKETKIIEIQKGGTIEHQSNKQITIRFQIPNHLAPSQEMSLISIQYRLVVVSDESHVTSKKASIPVTIEN